MPLQDRRASQRYPVELPVLFEHERGETRDISTSGVYILSDQHYPPKSDIAFTLRFDHAVPAQQKSLFFACRGHVLRAERQSDRHGMAIRFLDSSLNPSLSIQEGDIDCIKD